MIADGAAGGSRAAAPTTTRTLPGPFRAICARALQGAGTSRNPAGAFQETGSPLQGAGTSRNPAGAFQETGSPARRPAADYPAGMLSPGIHGSPCAKSAAEVS